MCFATEQGEDLDELGHVKETFHLSESRRQPLKILLYFSTEMANLTLWLVTCAVKSRTMTTLEKKQPTAA